MNRGWRKIVANKFQAEKTIKKVIAAAAGASAEAMRKAESSL